MPLHQIKSRFSGFVLFEMECGSLRFAVEAAVKGGAYLGGAYLHGANLVGANLVGANLGGANLGGANLHGANLGGHKVNGDIGIIQAGIPDNWDTLGFVDADTGELIVAVGCRVKAIAAGRAYWSSPEHPELEDRCEVLAALDYIEAVARLRGWTGAVIASEAA